MVLLKLLLATVSATTTNQQQPANPNGFPPGMLSRTIGFILMEGTRIDGPVLAAQEQPPMPPPSIDEIDVIRHREITSKAVSAIILLTLKWFKVSRKFVNVRQSCSLMDVIPDVMKFHHLGQHLLDTNCLLLILKMFGLQEVSVSVASKADAPENKYDRRIP